MVKNDRKEKKGSEGAFYLLFLKNADGNMTEDITMLEKLSERQLRLAMLLSMDSFYLEDLAKKIAVTKNTLI